MKKDPILFLAGGLGTRLRSLDATLPKPMVAVLGQPFLYWLVEHYEKQGFHQFLFSTGYKAETIESFPWKKHFPNSTFSFCREDTPLGSGGAVKKIFDENTVMQSAWVINGDTFLPTKLPEKIPPCEALYTALQESDVFDAKPNLVVQNDFVLEVGPQGQWFDSGAVWMNRTVLQSTAFTPPYSLHKLLEPSMKKNKVRYTILSGTCYDIGTPDRFFRFEKYLKERRGQV